MELLEFSFELNTCSGIAANLPLRWWDYEVNHYSVIERSNHVTIHVKGRADIIVEWLFNLAQDGRYKLIFSTPSPKTIPNSGL